MPKIGINIATGSLQQPEMIVGIDLGTTNSLVALLHPDSRTPIVLRDQHGLALKGRERHGLAVLVDDRQAGQLLRRRGTMAV